MIFFHVMSALAEMERELIVERTRAGLAAAREQGRIEKAEGMEKDAVQQEEDEAVNKDLEDIRRAEQTSEEPQVEEEQQ